MEMPWERRLRVLEEGERAEKEKREQEAHSANVAANGGAVWHWYQQMMQAARKANPDASTMDVMVCLFEAMAPAERGEVRRRIDAVQNDHWIDAMSYAVGADQSPRPSSSLAGRPGLVDRPGSPPPSGFLSGAISTPGPWEGGFRAAIVEGLGVLEFKRTPEGHVYATSVDPGKVT